MPQNAISVITQKSINNGNSFYHTAATTAGYLIHGGAGVLRSLHVNTAGTTAVVTLYDGTSTAGAVIGAFSANVQATLPLNLQYYTGLFLVVTGTAPDLTVSYN